MAKAKSKSAGPVVRCTKCNEELDQAKAVWLDLNWRTGEYRTTPWPEGESQGGFPFGSACAKRVAVAEPGPAADQRPASVLRDFAVSMADRVLAKLRETDPKKDWHMTEDGPAFTFEGVTITDPDMDESGRFEVRALSYYGLSDEAVTIMRLCGKSADEEG